MLGHRPTLPSHAQSLILHTLVALLQGSAEIRSKKRSAATSRIEEDPATALIGRVGGKNKKRKKGKKGKEVVAEGTEGVAAVSAEVSAIGNLSTSKPAPEETVILPTLSYIISGINAVTKQMESQIQSNRSRSSRDLDPASTSIPSITTTSNPIKIIFACRADVDPPTLIAHLPIMACAYNGTNPGVPPASEPHIDRDEDVILVPLGKGAEAALAEALGLRRVAVVAVTVRTELALCEAYRSQTDTAVSFQRRHSHLESKPSSLCFHNTSNPSRRLCCSLASTQLLPLYCPRSMFSPKHGMLPRSTLR